MTILLGCSKGLLQLGAFPRRLSCPLQQVTHLAWDGHHMAAADNTAHLLWMDGHVWPIEAGLETLAIWQGCCLLLSGDTDCLTLLDRDTGQPQIVTPVGVYPQDLCLLPQHGLMAVGGGFDGTLRLLSLEDLHIVHSMQLPGAVQRVSFSCGRLYVLCLTEDHGLQCLLLRLALFGNSYEQMACLPGLPGAIYADHSGGAWVSVSEYLYHFHPGLSAPDRVIPNMGLIRYISPGKQALLLTDPMMEQCSLLHADGTLQVLYHGDVGQALWIDERG